MNAHRYVAVQKQGERASRRCAAGRWPAAGCLQERYRVVAAASSREGARDASMSAAATSPHAPPAMHGVNAIMRFSECRMRAGLGSYVVESSGVAEGYTSVLYVLGVR